MSSDRARRGTIAPLTVALLLIVAAGCGRKEDPQPPPRKDPAMTTDLQIQQRGEVLRVTMTYPSLTMGGLALPGIDRVEYVRYVRPAPEFMELPAESPEEEGAAGEEAPSEEMASEEVPEEEVPEEESVEGEPTVEEIADEAAPEEPAETTGVEVEELELEEAPEAEGEIEEEAAAEMETTEMPLEGEEAPAALTPPPPNPFLQIRLDREEFDKQAEEVLVLEGTELEGAVVGAQIVARFPLEEIPTLPPATYSFQVRTFAGRLRSPESNIASFVPLPPPPSPTGLTVEPGPSGVEIRWVEPEGVRLVAPPTTALGTPPGTTGGEAEGEGEGAVEGEGASETEPEGDMEAETEPSEGGNAPGEPDPAGGGAAAEAEGQSAAAVEGESEAEGAAEEETSADEEGIEVVGYNVYRRIEPSDLYSAPIATLLPTETEYLDRGAVFGSTYSYAVTAVRMRQPLVESELSKEISVDYQDAFAPAAPTGLVLLAESGRTRLVWQAGPESDVVGYLVFVRAGDGELQQLTDEPVPANEYIHQGTVSGVRYTYSVVAVDTSGNQSEPSEESTTRAP